MKLTFTLFTLFFASMAVASSEAEPDSEVQRDQASSNHSGLGKSIVVAQADGMNDDGIPYQQILESFLVQDDFVKAKGFVDDLSETTDATPAILRSLNRQIRHARTTRIIEYAEKIREAITNTDFNALKDYNERMRRLTAREPLSNPASTDHVGTRGSETSYDQTPGALKTKPVPDTVAAPKGEPPLIAESAGLVRRMRTALDEDRLFPPSLDNAFDLAAARLSAAPDDLEAHRILIDLIDKQQTKVLVSLDEDRPETALKLNRQLYQSIEHLGTGASTERSSALHWIEQVRPDIIKSLTAGTEKAIVKHQLTYAPEGETSAEGYVSLLATELGQDHDDVTRLANGIIASYRKMIDRRLAKRQYDRALKLHARMEAIAVHFDVSIDQVAALGSHLETLPARQRQHDELLMLAAQWRDKGQLIEPAGANALEVAAKAVRLAVNPVAADKVFNDVITEQRQRIDRLIAAGRLQEAAGQLQQLGEAIEQISAKQLESATKYYAEAEQVLRRADLEDSQRQQRIENAEQDDLVAAAPAKPSRAKQSPFTFINPF